jgi:hypothetical protein
MIILRRKDLGSISDDFAFDDVKLVDFPRSVLENIKNDETIVFKEDECYGGYVKTLKNVLIENKSVENKGFTSEEQIIMDLIIEAHNLYSKLEKQHPSDLQEWSNSLHQLQQLLGMRILRRDIFPKK